MSVKTGTRSVDDGIPKNLSVLEEEARTIKAQFEELIQTIQNMTLCRLEGIFDE